MILEKSAFVKNLSRDRRVINKNLPKVVFKDKNALKAVREWLVPFSSIDVKLKFRFVLNLLGIDSTEVCVLNRYDSNDNSFSCHCKNSGRDFKMSLECGDMLDEWPGITISSQNESKTYAFQGDKLCLDQCVTNNPENGNSYRRSMFLYNAYFCLQNGEYQLTINVEVPNNLRPEPLSTFAFKLKNEEDLQQYLLGLTFPIDITEVYNKICEMSLDSVTEYPTLKIEVTKRINKKDKKTTDMISLRRGRLFKFVMTKDDKNIMIDCDGSWSYDSPKFSAGKDNEGRIKYHLNSVSCNSELPESENPIEQYYEACEEIEQAKAFVMTMLGDKKDK